MQRISFPVTAFEHPHQCLPHYTNSILSLSNGVSNFRGYSPISCQIYAKIFHVVVPSYLLACLSAVHKTQAWDD